MAYLGIGPASFTNNLTNVQILDDIKSGFNGTEDEFDLTSNDIPFQAVSDRALMVILGGVIQAPGVDYTINGTKITFTTPPVSGLTFYARNIYGLNALNGVNDGIVGPPAFTPGGPTWDSSGNVIISGNLTVQGATTTIQSTTLDVIDKDIKLASNQSTNAGIDTAGLLWGTTAVKLKYYNNGGTNPGLNIEGTNVGIGVTAPTAKLDVDGDVKFTGATSGRNMIWDKSNDYLMVNDNARIVFGNSGDLSIRHLSSDNKSYISSTTNDVVHEFNVGKNWSLTTTAADKRIHCPAESTDKSVELYWNGSKKFATTSSGIDVTGTVVADDLIVTGTSVVADLKSTNNNNVLGIAGNNATVKTYLGTDSSGNFLLATGSGVSTRLGISAADGHITPGAAGTQNLGSTSKEFNNLYLGDGGSAYFGNDQDFQIYHHSGGNSYIKETGGGALVINADDFYLQNVATTTYLRTHSSGQIDLTHSGNTKLSTSSTGVTVTGEVAASQDYPTIKPSLDLNFAATKTLDPRIEYYRYGPASYIDANGKVVFVGADVPRFDHDPDTGECLGLLIEEERRNLFLHGLRPGDRWNLKNGTFEENTLDTKAPDGTYTATKWTFTDADPYVYQTTTVNAVPYTMSIWVKAGTNTAGDWVQMRLGGGAPYSAEANSGIPADGSWHRIEWTRTPSAGSQNIGFEPEGAGSSMPASGDVIYVWGAQLESGNHASSLIPTTGSSVTRGADYAAIKGDEFTEWYNDLEGTIFTSHSLNSGVNDNSNSYVLEIGDAGSTHVAFRLQDVNSSFSNKPSWGSIYSSSATARFTGTGTFTRGNKVKSIMSGKGNDFAGTFNGETVQTDTTGSFFGPGTTGVMSIGRYGPSTGYELEGHIQRITYWPKQLTDTQLKTLTS